MYLLLISIFIGALVAAGFVYYFFIAEKSDRYEKALSLAGRGNYTDARAMVRTQLSRDPKNPRAHYTMSRIYAMERDKDGELEHLLEIQNSGNFTQEIGRIKVMTRIADIYYEKGRYRDSFLQYKEVLGHNRRNEEALARIAFMAIGQGEWEVAEAHFKELVQVAPDRADYHIARGVGLAMLRKDAAMDELEQALQAEPNNMTAQFLTALLAMRQKKSQRAADLIEKVLSRAEDPGLQYLANKLGVAAYYLNGNHERALEMAESCLNLSMEQGWYQEEYDSRLAIAYMAILLGDLEKSNDQLLELEVQNPNDELVIRVSDFRMDLEEGIATTEEISPRGFDLKKHLNNWVMNRFPDNALYKLSGLEMEESIDFAGLLQGQEKKANGEEASGNQPAEDPSVLIAKFNGLSEKDFLDACQRIIQSQGYKVTKTLPKKDKDGADFIASLKEDKNVKALFSIRQWANQPISDIFLRDLQNNMNELKVVQGFVIAGASLTPGAAQALENLKKIKVINEEDLGILLKQVLE